MTTMVEHVARALFETEKTRYFSDGTPITWGKAVSNCHNGRLSRCRKEARAAIDAMRNLSRSATEREMTHGDIGIPAPLTIGQMFQRDHSDFYPLTLEEIQADLIDRSWWEKIDARGVS